MLQGNWFIYWSIQYKRLWHICRCYIQTKSKDDKFTLLSKNETCANELKLNKPFLTEPNKFFKINSVAFI